MKSFGEILLTIFEKYSTRRSDLDFRDGVLEESYILFVGLEEMSSSLLFPQELCIQLGVFWSTPY